MDHLPVPQVDAGVSHVAAPAEEEEVSGKHLGEIHLPGHGLAHLGLFGAGAGQIDLKPVVDVLHEPGTIGGGAGLQGTAPSVRACL